MKRYLMSGRHLISGLFLPILIISQFFCTSLWFAGNAIAPELIQQFHLGKGALAHLTSSVQFGFITGTFVFALLSLSDRFSAPKVFAICALLAAACNISIALFELNISSLVMLRAATGFFLAGIYPVGMKIASDLYAKGLGLALGYLVGALVVGTAFPHLLKIFPNAISWRSILYITSALAVTGGAVIFLTMRPIAQKTNSQRFQLSNAFKVFNSKNFRSAAFGYFGHMWELYAFWAFVPIIISTYNTIHAHQLSVPLFSFIVIAFGGVACVASGYISRKYGSRNTAFTSLLLSGTCCLLSPLSFLFPPFLFVAFLIFWGLVVIADSPMFSTLVAQNAPAGLKGTALTIVTCIGFGITIVSIELIGRIPGIVDHRYIYLLLAPGPIFGLWAMYRKN